jgi:hypothetical protein
MYSSKTISLIIPHMPFPEADNALDRCLESYKGHYNELILVINDIGYGPAVNQGLKAASGDYLIVSNNDIELRQGTLRDLPWQEGFSVPSIIPVPRDSKPRSIFCMPRWVYETVNACCGFFYDPAYERGYFEDDDLHMRTTNIPVIVRSGILVNHLDGGGLSMKMMGEQAWFNKNQEVFKSKWS